MSFFFSQKKYSDDPLDHATNDDKTAKDNLAFLEGFLEKFPHFVNRTTYFAGESYGGVYIPFLTRLVLQDSNSQLNSQLAGIILGNPVMSCGSSTTANQMQLYYYHGLVSYVQFGAFLSKNCTTQDSMECDSILQAATDQIGVIDQELKKRIKREPSLDPDNLYQDFCSGNGIFIYRFQS